MFKRSKKTFALGRLKSGEMNRYEAAYARYLDKLKLDGKVIWWKFEGLTFKMAKRTSYTPDFIVQIDTLEIQLHEIKGSLKYIQDDAKVKVKINEEMFAPFRMFLVEPASYISKTKPYDGEWNYKEVGA